MRARGWYLVQPMPTAIGVPDTQRIVARRPGAQAPRTGTAGRCGGARRYAHWPLPRVHSGPAATPPLAGHGALRRLRAPGQLPHRAGPPEDFRLTVSANSYASAALRGPFGSERQEPPAACSIPEGAADALARHRPACVAGGLDRNARRLHALFAISTVRSGMVLPRHRHAGSPRGSGDRLP